MQQIPQRSHAENEETTCQACTMSYTMKQEFQREPSVYLEELRVYRRSITTL